MMQVIKPLLLLMILSGCQPSTDQHREDDPYDAHIYQALSAGHYEEFNFETRYLHGVVMDFEATPVWGDDEDQSRPRVALVLKDLNRTHRLRFEYYLTDEPYLALVVMAGDDVWFEEIVDIESTQPIKQLSMELEDGNVFMRAGHFEHAMGVPFDAEFLVVMNVSVEVTNQLDFTYR
jgi:hypothetical protein